MKLTKEERIQEELKRIGVWFEDVGENDRAMIDPLLQNCAFMKVTLDDLQEEINAEGVVEHYQNGANQYGVKQSSKLRSYNALVKSYAAVNKTLSSYLTRLDNYSLSYVEKLRMKAESEEIQRLQKELEKSQSETNAALNDYWALKYSNLTGAAADKDDE